MKFGKNYHRRDTCRSCKGKNLKLVLKHSPTPLGEEYIPEKKEQDYYPVEVYMCEDCKLLQLIDVVDPEILYREYFYVTTLSLGLVKHFEDYASSVVHKLSVSAGDFIVDIGSNDGVLLKAFKNNNMNVLGVDPAVEIAKKATEAGLETIPDFFTPKLALEINKKYGKAKVITANNVLANVDNLDGIIDGVKELLDSDGVFIVEAAYALDVIQNTIIDNIYHEHLTYFSAKSFKNFFEIRGMEVFDIERSHMKGGSIRVFAQLKGGKRKISQSVEELIVLEEGFGLYDIQIFNNFDNRIAKERKRIVEILKKAKSEGKIIAGFGASVGATVILYNLEIGQYIDFIIDDYKPKQNLFSPGFNIPTFPTEEIYKRKTDIIVNLAWRYAPPFIRKNKAFVDNGGKILTPISKFGELEIF